SRRRVHMVDFPAPDGPETTNNMPLIPSPMCATSWRCLRRSCEILLVAMYADMHPSPDHPRPPTALNHGSCEHGVLGCKAQKTPVHDKDERVFLTLHERIRGVYTV